MAAGDGLISMTPTSIAYSGTSASINADGGVDFTAVTSLSLNGVFTSDYDNYFVAWNAVADADRSVKMILRSAGSDATGTDYTVQYIVTENTTLTVARDTSEVKFAVGNTNTVSGAAAVNIYGPYLSQPTAVRADGGNERGGGRLTMYAGTHSLSSSYDGFTFQPNNGNLTGNIHVFGYEE